MKIMFCLIGISAMLVISGQLCCASAQEQSKPSKIEIGVQFSSISFSADDGGLGLSVSGRGAPAEAGFGGRFTFNLNKHIALEAEGNFFPHGTSRVTLAGGRMLQGQFGVKAGQRFKRFGLFAKARPGVISIGDVVTFVQTPGQPFFDFVVKRKQFFSLDVGGVVEFYPSRRILTRIDAGDTMIRNGNGVPLGAIFFGPSSPSLTHNLQISAGIGFRLISPEVNDNMAPAPTDKRRRFEVGGQFSSLSQSIHEGFSTGAGFPDFQFRDTQTQIGGGGRLTYNLSRSLALEAEGNFFPRETRNANNARSGGRMAQGQFGIKVGKRFTRFGVFAKARPGIVSFSKVPQLDSVDLSQGFSMINFHIARRTYFSADLGGVLEFYPSRRIVTRFDAGDTLIRYGKMRIPTALTPTFIAEISPNTQHNFQFSAGVGLRF